MESRYINEIMDNACKDYYCRFQNAFGDVKSGTVISDSVEIHRRLLSFSGHLPYVESKDNIWWARGMKAMPIHKVSCSSPSVYHFGRIECNIIRIIPYDCSSKQEVSFVYILCGGMPSVREEAITDNSCCPLWRVQPITIYEGSVIDEGLANDSQIIDEDGNYHGVSQDDLIRFDRFITPQNIVLTSKASPVVRYESTLVWDLMDEILCKKAKEDDLRRMIQETDCYLHEIEEKTVFAGCGLRAMGTNESNTYR